MAKLLTLDETKKYLKEWREQENEKAFELLILKNIGLVNKIASKFLNSHFSFEELKSTGTLGLINAINKFNYNEYDVKAFSSYACTSIENTIKREIAIQSKHDHVISFNEPIGNNKDGDETKLEDVIGTEEEALLESVISEIKTDIVKEALNCLTSREKQIIFLRYGLDEKRRKTQEELAEMFGCSKTTIMNQEQKALIKMRHPRNTKKLKDFIE